MRRMKFSEKPIDLMGLDALSFDMNKAAKVLGMSRRTFAQKVRDGDIAHANISSGTVPRYRFSDRMLLDYMRCVTKDAKSDLKKAFKNKDKQGLKIVIKTPGFDELERQAKKRAKKKASPQKKKL